MLLEPSTYTGAVAAAKDHLLLRMPYFARAGCRAGTKCRWCIATGLPVSASTPQVELAFCDGLEARAEPKPKRSNQVAGRGRGLPAKALVLMHNHTSLRPTALT